jgi:hypothetical protein
LSRAYRANRWNSHCGRRATHCGSRWQAAGQQWDPNRKLSEQYPHIAITVLYAPQSWTDDYREVLRKQSALIQSCFKLKAVVWLDANRSKPTDEFQWCVEHDMYMSELQATYLYSMNPSRADYGQTTGINRTDGPQPPETLLPNDRATLDMQAKTNPHGASKDLNLDELSLFAIMFANVRKDLGPYARFRRRLPRVDYVDQKGRRSAPFSKETSLARRPSPSMLPPTGAAKGWRARCDRKSVDGLVEAKVAGRAADADRALTGRSNPLAFFGGPVLKLALGDVESQSP